MLTLTSSEALSLRSAELLSNEHSGENFKIIGTSTRKKHWLKASNGVTTIWFNGADLVIACASLVKQNLSVPGYSRDGDNHTISQDLVFNVADGVILPKASAKTEAKQQKSEATL